jgi:hypothetical protein
MAQQSKEKKNIGMNKPKKKDYSEIEKIYFQG